MNKLDLDLKNIIVQLPKVPESRNYWMVRTDEGKLYQYFVENNIIGIKLNDVSLLKLLEIREQYAYGRSNKTYDYKGLYSELEGIVIKKYKRKLRESFGKELTKLKTKITRTVRQIFKITFEMKVGDYVVIPSKDSAFISIGYINSKEVKSSDQTAICRDVEWTTHKRRLEVDINFNKLFFSHQAITNITKKYSDVILRELYDFYIIGDEAHSVLNITRTGNINAYQESAFNYKLLELIREFLYVNDLNYNLSQISTIVNLNSPGKRKWWGKAEIVFIVGLFLTIIIGGKTRVANKELNTETSGIVTEINKYLDSKKRREVVDELVDHADSMSLEKQKVLLELIDKLE